MIDYDPENLKMGMSAYLEICSSCNQGAIPNDIEREYVMSILGSMSTV